MKRKFDDVKEEVWKAMKKARKDHENLDYVDLAEEMCQLFKEENGACFSGWKKDAVYHFLGITKGKGVPKEMFVGVPTVDLGPACEVIVERMKETSEVFGIANEGKESKKIKFIDDVIKQVIIALKRKHQHKMAEFVVGVEESLKGVNAWGFVEYVFKLGEEDIFIIEAKKDSLADGIVQLLMELEVAGAKSKKVVRGFVTTLGEWVLITRKADKTFVQHTDTFPITNPDAPSPEQLKPLCSALAFAIEEKL